MSLDQVELILLGEELRKAVARGKSTNEAELLRRLRASWAAKGPLDRMPDGEEIFLFPNTEAGWLATVRAATASSALADLMSTTLFIAAAFSSL